MTTFIKAKVKNQNDKQTLTNIEYCTLDITEFHFRAKFSIITALKAVEFEIDRAILT